MQTALTLLHIAGHPVWRVDFSPQTLQPDDLLWLPHHAMLANAVVRRQAEHRLVRREELARMRLEGERRARTPLPCRKVNGIGPRSEGGFGLDIQLDVSLPGVPREQAQELVEKAHHVCPYSNATRNNVPVRLKVV